MFLLWIQSRKGSKLLFVPLHTYDDDYNCDEGVEMCEREVVVSSTREEGRKKPFRFSSVVGEKEEIKR